LWLPIRECGSNKRGIDLTIERPRYSITNHGSVWLELASSSDQARLEIHNFGEPRPPLHCPPAKNCAISVDGLIARADYEHEFTLHQFTILPGGAAQKFEITQFDKINIT
jgi:hypothetical protein